MEISSTKWDVVPVLDISAGGLSFNYTKSLGTCSLLDFKIGISILTPAINCVAEIIRIEEPRHHSMCRIATGFTRIDKQEKEMINATVKKVWRRKIKLLCHFY